MIPTTVREGVLRFVRSSFGRESQKFVKRSKLGCTALFWIQSVKFPFFPFLFLLFWVQSERFSFSLRQQVRMQKLTLIAAFQMSTTPFRTSVKMTSTLASLFPESRVKLWTQNNILPNALEKRKDTTG